MTDSRVSRAVLQVLVRTVPDARVSRAVMQVLDRPVPDARVSRAVLQVLTSTVAGPVTRIPVRSVGSSRPILEKQSDGSWAPLQARGS